MNPPEMENTNPQQNNPNYNPYNQNFGQGGFQPVPNGVGVLVLGILSIVFCWCYGLISVILGIIAIVLAGQAEKLYNANPQIYSLSSYKNMRAGKICAIIGLSLGSLWFILFILSLLIKGVSDFNSWSRF